MKKGILYVFLTLTALFLGSCASKNKMVYLINNNTDSTNIVFEEVKIQPDDILQIIITSDNPEISEPFNLRRYNITPSKVQGTIEPTNLLLTYLVDVNGFVDMPKLGPVKLGGLTRTEAVIYLKQILKDYIKNPGVNVRIANFKYAILGEVNKPGTFEIDGQRITIFEALANAGDLSTYGHRQNIKIIREENGTKQVGFIDITDNNVINSPYYYLKQNDVVYVEPNQVKLNSSKFGPSVSTTISIISLVVSLIIVISR